jgi:hypothetical protein
MVPIDTRVTKAASQQGRVVFVRTGHGAKLGRCLGVAAENAERLALVRRIRLQSNRCQPVLYAQ